MKMLTLPEVAKILGVTRCRVWQMLKEKKIKALKFSHVYAVKSSEVKKVLKLKELEKIKNLENNHEKSDSVPSF